MALDHFIPQVHLRRFLSEGGRLNAVRKSDGRIISPRTQDVCRIDEGNTNPYLNEPRAVEEFLKRVEPRYNAAVDALRAGSLDASAFEVIARFLAYVATCTPAAMRIHSELPRRAVETTAAMLDARGMLPPAPDVLGGATLPDLIRDGTVEIEVAPKFPQAVGIQEIERLVALFCASSWELLHNKHAESPFVTSDYPVAIEPTDDPRVIAKIVPLAPDLAVRVVPTLSAVSTTGGGPISLRRRRVIHRDEAVKLNRMVVRCAENVVFFPDGASWAPRLVARNRAFRVIPVSRSFPTERGVMWWFTYRVSESERASWNE